MIEKERKSLQPEVLIRMRGVSKSYQTAGGEFQAIKAINLDIYPGEFLAVIGKSGAGKPTLINMLTGVDHLTTGEVWVGGVPVHQLNENRLADWRGRELGIIYQSFHLMPSLSLVHNVMLPMDFNGLYRGRQRLAYAMDSSRLNWKNTPISCPRPFLVGSSSGWPLRAPWPMIRPS